jgi:hypothetical protein
MILIAEAAAPAKDSVARHRNERPFEGSSMDRCFSRRPGGTNHERCFPMGGGRELVFKKDPQAGFGQAESVMSARCWLPTRPLRLCMAAN